MRPAHLVLTLLASRSQEFTDERHSVRRIQPRHGSTPPSTSNRPRSSGSARRTAGTARAAGSATPCSTPPIWSRVSGCSTSAAGGKHDNRGRPAGGAYRRRGRRRHLRPGARARSRAGRRLRPGRRRLHRGGCPVHPFESGAFDVISRFGTMFFDDPVAAFANLRRALRPGGRLAIVAGRVRSRASGPPSPSRWRSPSSGDRLTSARPAGRARSLSRTATDSAASSPKLGSGRDTRGHHPADADGSDVEDVVGMVAETPQSKASLPVSPRPRSGQRSAPADAFAPYARPEGVVMNGTAWLLTARR